MSGLLDHAKLRALCKAIKTTVEMEKARHLETDIAAKLILELAREIQKEAEKYVSTGKGR
jgi:hypothetical protein